MPAAIVVARLLFIGFFFLTSLYGLLVYTPFTHTHVIQAGLLPWLSWFAHAHAYLYWCAQAIACATLESDFRSPSTRAIASAYAAAAALAGVALLFHPVLPSMQNDRWSFAWSEIALAPPLLLSLVDHAVVARRMKWSWTSTREDGSILAAGALCLLVVFVTYSATFHVRAAPGLALTPSEEATGLLWSFLLHASFVGAAFVVWVLVRALAAWACGQKASVEYGIVLLLAMTLFLLLARNVAFSAISLEGTAATLAAASWAFVLVLAASGAALRKAAGAKRPVESGLRLLFYPFSAHFGSLALRLLWMAAVLAVAVRLQIVASRMDWNGLMQKLFACLGWVLVFSSALAVFPAQNHGGGRTILFIGAASAGTLAYGAWRTMGNPADSAPILDKLAVAEPSFGLLHDLAGSGSKRESMAELFAFMQKNTNIPHERHIEPINVQFASDLGSTPRKRPHIFIIVIDSLRRDYLSPFNPAVTFTPALAKFARASDVFANAFTHYGATGLSEPSIWLGGMMPHQQYITPFAPMNSLEKMLLADHYVRMVSVDSILTQLLDRSAPLVAMDANKVTGDYDLCSSLEELRGKVDARREDEAPLFAYTQPQNIHVSRITREGASVPSGAHFPGFYEPYAARLQRIDACFGQFIDYLESKALYDESVVVFTADHGDLLGEEGRWGHAYNLNPEVVRIPLIIHRPARLRDLPVDTAALAFSTDIAPSLYRLLGYMPATLGAGFGQSLYGPRSPQRDWHLLVSSYGPVYGVLEDDARHLYVADAVNYTDSYFDVARGSNAPREPVTEDVRARNVQRILAGVKELHQAFHVEP